MDTEIGRRASTARQLERENGALRAALAEGGQRPQPGGDARPAGANDGAALEVEVARLLTQRQRGAERLAELEAQLAALRGQEGEMARQAAEARAELDQAREEKLRLDRQNEALETRIGELRATAATQQALEARIGQLEAAAATVANLEAERDALGAKVATLEAAVADRDRLDGERTALSAKVAELGAAMAERTRLQGERDALAAKVAELNAALADRARLEGERAALAAKVERLEAQASVRRGGAQAEVAQLEGEIERLVRNKELAERDLAAAEVLTGALAEDRDQALAERDVMATRVDALAERLGRIAEDHGTVLARLDERTADNMNWIERTIGMTGLDLGKLMLRLGFTPQALGGPYIAADPVDEPGAELAGRIAKLEVQIDRLEALRRIVSTLPLSPPLDNSWVTGGFGRRKDPITGEWAMHGGIDLGANANSLVVAPSPGRVTFVGWKGGYGKMIEIDHGLGVRTRYGHLKQIYVKRDQLVEFQEKIGVVGNTGRTTGLHLHFEVAFDDDPQDPANFLRAGRYVFKQ